MSAPSQTTAAPVGSAQKLAMLSTSSAMFFAHPPRGLVSLFGDAYLSGGAQCAALTPQAPRGQSLHGRDYCRSRELLGYGLRLMFGYLADRTGRYWTLTIVGFAINLLAIPALALVGRREIAIGLLFAERIGKAIRNPARDAMLSYATQTLGTRVGLRSASNVRSAWLVARTPGADRGPRHARHHHRRLPVRVCRPLSPRPPALMTLLLARSLFPGLPISRARPPHVGTSGYRRGYWWFVIAAGMVGAGFADFPLMAYHFKAVTLTEDQWMPTSYSAAMVLAMLAGLLGGKLSDRLGMTVVMAWPRSRPSSRPWCSWGRCRRGFPRHGLVGCGPGRARLGDAGRAGGLRTGQAPGHGVRHVPHGVWGVLVRRQRAHGLAL